MSERGSVTPLLAAVTGVVVVSATLLVGLHLLAGARVAAQTAADAAALAAVDGGRAGAARAADANGGEVVRCRCPSGGPVAVVVRITVRIGPIGPVPVAAGARAARVRERLPGPDDGRRPGRR